MSNDLIIRPAAEEEIRQAYLWYEERRKGLGDDFLLCLEETFEKINSNPLLFQVIHKNIRRALIQRFPYGIFYIIDKGRVVIVAVFHGNRDPKKWKQRM
ncbi:type II toxin-antitoxin system RelE/ParE family toxin [candidate division CSSED10-310 bacterium]|uniref:Type II toxin-antitoxin system RelE/ParE family toxin n=1 Tax=candidate division CSSED10-310 bacterium TaxID=2855610 RepID=A0ABV6YUN2_UNCC1